MNKPIIGIVSKHYATYKSNKIDTFVNDDVKQAIFDNGGIAHNIKVDKNSKFYNIVAFCEDGYPDESPKPRPRKELNEVLEWF